MSLLIGVIRIPLWQHVKCSSQCCKLCHGTQTHQNRWIEIMLDGARDHHHLQQSHESLIWCENINKIWSCAELNILIKLCEKLQMLPNVWLMRNCIWIWWQFYIFTHLPFKFDNSHTCLCLGRSKLTTVSHFGSMKSQISQQLHTCASTKTFHSNLGKMEFWRCLRPLLIFSCGSVVSTHFLAGSWSESPFGLFLQASKNQNSTKMVHFDEFVIEFDNSYTLCSMFCVRSRTYRYIRHVRSTWHKTCHCTTWF